MPEFIERPATLQSLNQRKPVHGVGINNARYLVKPRVNEKCLCCPYYRVWVDMITRSYSEKYQAKKPTYVGCSVTQEWVTFLNFRAWMETQDWQGKEIDKDLLVPGNKVYGPDTCIFVSRQINTLLIDSGASRGEYPQGVSWHNRDKEYRSYCNVNGRQVHLGYFDLATKAEHAYLVFKSKLIKSIAYEDEAISNPKLHKALLNHAKLFENKANKISL